MRHHQKYFSVESAPGKLAPHFVAVMNTSGDPEGLVKRGNERVLKARFNDARFFWDVDQHKKLADRVADLSHVTFQAKLGSYLEKTERIVKLVDELGGNAHAQRAAYLSKADLTTEMVKEFTDLQGQVGGLYARHQGEPESVAQGRLRSLQAAEHGGRNPVHARRPTRRTSRQAGYLTRLLRRRPGADGFEGPVRSPPRRARRRQDPGRSEARTTNSMISSLATCANSCWIASNISSARFAASSTTK